MTPARIIPLRVLQARAEARAILWRAFDLDYEEAIAPLHHYALTSGIVDDIGAAATAAIIEAPFKESEPDAE